MRVVTLEKLLTLPKGTVFTKYPLGLYELQIKGDPHGEANFSSQSLSSPDGEGCEELYDTDVEITGDSFPINTDCAYPDDDVSKDDLFVVYSVNDTQAVIVRLIQAVIDSTSWPT